MGEKYYQKDCVGIINFNDSHINILSFLLIKDIFRNACRFC